MAIRSFRHLPHTLQDGPGALQSPSATIAGAERTQDSSDRSVPADIRFALAHSRIIASLIDGIIILVPTVGIITLLIFGKLMDQSDGPLLYLVYPVVHVLYFSFMESSKRQATVGKYLCGIQVTDRYFDRITFLHALGREVAKLLLSLACGILALASLLLIAFDDKKQALHDMLAGTFVVIDPALGLADEQAGSAPAAPPGNPPDRATDFNAGSPARDQAVHDRVRRLPVDGDIEITFHDDYIGKSCPYCQSAIKPGIEVRPCPQCGIPHHPECWQENGGCTTYGCREAAPAMPPAQVEVIATRLRCTRCGMEWNAPPNRCPRCVVPERARGNRAPATRRNAEDAAMSATPMEPSRSVIAGVMMIILGASLFEVALLQAPRVMNMTSSAVTVCSCFLIVAVGFGCIARARWAWWLGMFISPAMALLCMAGYLLSSELILFLPSALSVVTFIVLLLAKKKEPGTAPAPE